MNFDYFLLSWQNRDDKDRFPNKTVRTKTNFYLMKPSKSYAPGPVSI